MLCVNVVCITGMYDCDRIRLPIVALPGTSTALRPTRSFSRYRDNSILSGTQSRSKTNTTHLTSCSFLLTHPFALSASCMDVICDYTKLPWNFMGYKWEPILTRKTRQTPAFFECSLFIFLLCNSIE